MQKRYNKPKNWQDFELLCANLWKSEYNCYDINLHGRLGQNQHGVDVYGYINNGSELFGIQCKGKDEYNNSKITKSEIDSEITKALAFEPTLSLFIIATTSSRDEEIQKYIRIKDQEIFQSKKVHITIKFWDCIEELLDLHHEVKDWYEGTFSKSYAIMVDAVVEKGVFTPRFNKVQREYKYGSLFLGAEPIVDILHQRPYKNHTWCEFDICLTNIGKSVIEDYSLELTFDNTQVRAISNLNDSITNSIWEPELNKIKFENMELFHRKNNDFSLILEPKNRVLVQNDSKCCRIGLFPKYTTKEIVVKWKFLARDYNEENILSIPVSPSFVEVKEVEFIGFGGKARIENVIEEGIEYLDKDQSDLFDSMS